jgi:hypothetical protein
MIKHNLNNMNNENAVSGWHYASPINNLMSTMPQIYFSKLVREIIVSSVMPILTSKIDDDSDTQLVVLKIFCEVKTITNQEIVKLFERDLSSRIRRKHCGDDMLMLIPYERTQTKV